MKFNPNRTNKDGGFTLVELAIVMIIIGLLIGGVMKGQELVSNARMTASITKTKAIDAALNTFSDTYGGRPGDITQAATRIANCTNRCNNDGNGDGRIGGTPGGAQLPESENLVAWAQLGATDLLGEVRNTPVSQEIEGGITNPTAEVPGQFYIGYAVDVYDLKDVTTSRVRSGHYLALHNAVSGTATSTEASYPTTSITAEMARRIDLKMDDGAPSLGSVMAMGGADPVDGCSSSNNFDSYYVTTNSRAACGLYIRSQQ